MGLIIKSLLAGVFRAFNNKLFYKSFDITLMENIFFKMSIFP